MTENIQYLHLQGPEDVVVRLVGRTEKHERMPEGSPAPSKSRAMPMPIALATSKNGAGRAIGVDISEQFCHAMIGIPDTECDILIQEHFGS